MSAVPQRSFAGGELTPSLHARTDLAKYSYGLRTLRNFFVMKTGGAASRPGTVYVPSSAKEPDVSLLLVPFVFNSTQTYMLEFGDNYMRVITNGAYLTVSPAAYNGATNYVQGDNVVSVGINYSAKRATVGDTPASSPDDWHPMTGNIYEVYNPYNSFYWEELSWSQSGDVIIFAHNGKQIRKLSRLGNTSWTWEEFTPGATITAPTGLSGTPGAAGSNTYFYGVSTVSDATGEESVFAGTTVASAAEPTVADPIDLTWTPVTGAREYLVYRFENGSYNHIGTTVDASFSDPWLDVDVTRRVIYVDREPFAISADWPGVVTHSKQRRVFARTTNNPEGVFASNIGLYGNFNKRTPLEDSDALDFTIAGPQVNRIRHLIELRRMVIMTEAAEWIANGDESGTLTPDSINLEKHSEYGSSSVRPVIVGDSAIFIQARGHVVRDLNFQIDGDGYRGNDLSIFSSHLFEGHEIVDMTYQQSPNSIIWMVRDDGVLLSLTYIREHQIWAWARHDTDGFYEQVRAVPEGNEDAVYFVVRRIIDGGTERFIERMSSRYVTTDLLDGYIGMDCALNYDGWGDGLTEFSAEEHSGNGYLAGANIRVRSSTSVFVVGDVGKTFRFRLTADGSEYRCTIVSYDSGFIVYGTFNKDIPASTQFPAYGFNEWGREVTTISGLDHLEGEAVSVLGDGFVLASPNNPSYDLITVTSGAITLPEPIVKAVIGLPFISDLETLDIDSPQGESLADKKKLITAVSTFFEKTRGGFVGPRAPTDDEDDALEGLSEIKYRTVEEGGTYADALSLVTGYEEVSIEGNWNANGRVFVRQVDPLPMTIGCIVPKGMVPYR